MLEAVRAVADGRLSLVAQTVQDADGNALPGGLDLTEEVERSVGGV
jgi:hypothetical protein